MHRNGVTLCVCAWVTIGRKDKDPIVYQLTIVDGQRYTDGDLHADWRSIISFLLGKVGFEEEMSQLEEEFEACNKRVRLPPCPNFRALHSVPGILGQAEDAHVVTVGYPVHHIRSKEEFFNCIPFTSRASVPKRTLRG